MAVNTQIIEIVTKFVDGASKKIREVHQRVEELGGGYQRVTNTTKALNERTNRLTKTMQVQRVVAKRFQMQWLSILFFGMALQRMFGGLIRTSLEWTGVTEIMSLALGILFLPLADILLGWALAFLEVVGKLTPTQKKWIGIVVLSVIALGGLLMVLGQVALGLAGMKWLAGAIGIGKLGTAATGATGKLALLRTALGKTILIAAGITIAWVGFKFIKTGIEEGSLLKEAGGIIGMGLGLGAIGLAVGGPWGAGIGFVLGITAAVVIDFVMGGTVGKKVADIASKLAQTMALTLPPFQEGGIVPGRLGSPVPILAHAGERVIPVGRGTAGGGGGSVMINATYNVTVSDRREFEVLLRENNIKLTEDVRRLVKV